MVLVMPPISHMLQSQKQGAVGNCGCPPHYTSLTFKEVKNDVASARRLQPADALTDRDK